MTAKQTTTENTPTADTSKAPSEEPKKDIMGIERDDKNARISFTPDGNLMIVTLPIGKMPRALVHGFIYEMHQMVNDWHEERKKTQIIMRDEVNKFSFKKGISKLFK